MLRTRQPSAYFSRRNIALHPGAGSPARQLAFTPEARTNLARSVVVWFSWTQVALLP